MTDIDSFKKELDSAFPTKTPQQERVMAEMDVEAKKQEYANQLKMPSAPSSGGFLDTTKIKPEAGLKLQTPNFNVDEIFSKTNSGEYIAKFDTYTPGIDNYDKFSREQSTGDKWLNGATQFTQTVVNSIAGLGNLVYGTGAMIKEGELSSFYDNEYMNWLDDVSEKRRLNNPIYKTYEEQEMGFGESMGTASFWADDFLQGASFTAGMIASELVLRAATGGLVGGVGLSRAGLSATTQGASKLNTLKNAMGLARTAAVKPITTAMSNVLPKLSGVTFGANVGKIANIVRTGVTSAGYEAGFEARHFMREMRANFEEDFIEANGVAPTEEDRAEFESALKSKANGLFAFNVAVVGASNIAQFGSALGLKLPKIKGLSSNPDSWINRKVFGVGVSDGAIATATMGNKLARVGYTFGKNAFLEGFVEEGLQGVGSKTAEKMLKDSYSLNNANQTMGYANSFYQSMSEQYGTEEGLKEVYLGMLIGALTGSATNLVTARSLADKNFKALDQRAKGIESQLLKGGSYSADNITTRLLSANRTVANKRDEQKAIQEGDISGVQTARHSEMFNQTLRGIELNYLDQIKEQTLQQLDILSDAEVAEMAGVEVSDASRVREELKQEYKNETKVIEDTINASKELIAGSLNKGEYNFAIEEFQKRGYSKEMANATVADMLQKSLAYEMYIGKVAYEQADNFLNTFLNEVQSSIGSTRVKKSFGINDTLNRSGKAARRNFNKTKKELQQTVSELEQLEKDYRRVENVISQTTAETGNRQQLVGQLNDLVTKREELNKRKQELEANANALLSSAKLETPFGATVDATEITAEEILSFEEDVAKTLEDLRKVSPEKAERLGGMLYEYQKSVNAYKTLDKRVKQLTDPNVGLRTKKGLLPSLFGRKTPNEQTAEMIRGLINTHYQLDRNTQEGVEQAVAKAAEEQLVEVGVDKKEILDYLKDQPYLFEQYNESTENIIPTEAEIEEYYDFAQRNIAGEEPLTDEEKARFEELNTKLANWYLTESTPLADVLKQQALRETKVEETVEEDLTDEDVDGMLEKDKKAGRPFNFLQTVQDVYLQFYKDSNTYYFSHLSPRGFLEFIGATTDLKVQRKDSKKVETFSLDDELKTGDRVFFGNNMSFTLEDGARIKIVTSKENFNSFGFKTRMTASGYSVVYDGDKVMKSDYADIDTYSPQEIMSLSNGDEIFAFIDMEDSYNQSLTEEEFENNVKISFRDAQGNKIADLKALHLSEAEDTSIPEKFLEARAKAKELAWGKTGSIELGNATVETVFLGAPNVVLENGVEKWQPVDENLIEDSGMWDGGKLTTKNGTKGVRTDLLKEINKKVPIVVVKVGNTLIAYPVRGGKVASNMAETFTEKGAKLALKINETLIQNGKKPAQIYYNSETDQNMYSEDGTPTQELQDALDRVNNIPTESTNIAEAEINIDLNGVPFLAPKMAINLDSFQTVNVAPVGQTTSQSNITSETKVEDVLTQEQKDNLEKAKKGEKASPAKTIFNSVQDLLKHSKSLLGKTFNVKGLNVQFVDYKGEVLTGAGQRVFVKVLINGVPVTFYSSTGSGKKALQEGVFYPTLGIEADERFNGTWINKIDGVEMASYYDSASLAAVGAFIDSQFGNTNSFAGSINQNTTDLQNPNKEALTKEKALEIRREYNSEYLNSGRETFSNNQAKEVTQAFKDLVNEIRGKVNNTQPAQKPKSRLDLQDDYFTLDFKTYAYFRDTNGDIYTKEVGEIARAKTMSNMVKTLPKAEQERVKQAWTKQPPSYFESENFEKVVPNVGTSSRTKQGKKNKDKEC